MFLKRTEDGLAVTAGPSSPVTAVTLGGFSFVSAMRWNQQRNELLLTGTSVDTAGPNLSTNSKGDLRLYRFPFEDSSWAEVCSRYAHDPVYSPEFGYAVHSGNGIAFVDQDGLLQREVKVGRFNWGCPALSVSPDGERLGWVRWKGDDMKPRVERLEGDGVEFKTSVARYAWYDDDTLLARSGGLPFLLDLPSGTTKAFAKTVRADLVDAPSTPHEFRDLLALANSKVWQRVGDLAVVGGRVYFDLTVTEQRSSGQRFDGLVSVDLDGGDPRVHLTVGPAERIKGFVVRGESLALSIATYEDMTVIGRHTDYVGPAADFLADGWVPMRTSTEPSFGSHAPLETV